MQEPVTATAVVDDIEVEQSGPADAAPAPVSAPPPPVEAIEDADEEIEAPEPETPEPPKAAKPARSIQAKIDQAVGRQREAERRAEAAERELQALRQPRQDQPTDSSKREPQYTRPKPTEAEIGSKYADYPAFVEDLADWKLEQRDAAQAVMNRRQAHQQRHEAHAEQFSSRIAEAEKADPAYWSKIDPKIANLLPSTALDPDVLDNARYHASQGNRDAQLFLSRTVLADIIFDSEYSTDLMAHLSANLSDFQRLSTLHPTQLHREMGRLEAQFIRTAAATSGPAPTRPVSQAPPPIKPVGTSASAASEVDLDDDMSEEGMNRHIRSLNARDKQGRFKAR